MKTAPAHVHIANEAIDEPDAAIIRLAKQANQACREGRLSKAARIVDSIDQILTTTGNPAAAVPRRLSTAEERELIGRLFPPATDRDVLRAIPADIDPLQLEVEDVAHSVTSLKVDKAAGHSGLTPRFLRRILSHGTPTEQLSIATSLTRVFNRLLAGKTPRSVRHIWLAGRAVFIPKPGSDTFRPLGIAETLYRFLGSIVSSKRAHGVGQSLLPHQLGLGIPGGAEICAVIADLGYQRNRCEASLHIVPNDDGFATANDDVVNAFNTMPRSVQQEGLFTYAPDLLHLHYWSHSDSTPLYNSTGTLVGSSCTGGNQGDAFTQFYFAVGLQPLLDEMHTMMRAIEDRLSVPEADRGSLAAFFDDINISGTTPVVFELSLATEALFAKYGLKINKRKSHILGPKVHTTAGAPPEWRLEHYRASTLGRPLGGTDDQAEVVAATMGANPPPLLALRRLPAHHRFLIIKHCINHRYDYLRKVLSNKVTGSVNSFREFDSKIDLCLAEIVTPSSSQCLEAIRSLPVHNGGLGMPRLAGPEHARHAFVTAARVRNFIVAHHPTLFPVHADLRQEMNMLIAEETGYDPDSLKDIDRVSRCAVAKLQDRTFRDVLHQLRS
jgi:hypothetical protein